MIRTIATATTLSLTLLVLPVAAATPAADCAAASPADDCSVVDHGVVSPVLAQSALVDPGRAETTRVSRALARPRLLPALYVSYVALQAYDVYSTRQTLARGGRETNPLMRGVVGHPVGFAALKMGAAAGTIVAVERLWKTHKMAAIAVMVASNSVAALVAARNARTLRQLR